MIRSTMPISSINLWSTSSRGAREMWKSRQINAVPGSATYSLMLRNLTQSRTLAPGASAGGEHGEISMFFAPRLRVSVAVMRKVSYSVLAYCP